VNSIQWLPVHIHLSNGHDRVRTSLLRTILGTPSNLGNLQPLPLEVVYEICSLLDIRSVFNFRHVNRRALQIVRATYGYEEVILHASLALCVLLRTNIASWFTISDLFKTRCTRDCHLCGSFGGFIFLPSFMRCCFSCIRQNNLPPVLPASVVKRHFKLSPRHLYSLVPTVATLPGTYSKEGIVEKKRLQIKPTDFVSRLFSRREGRMTGEPRQTKTPLLNYTVTTSLPYLDAEIDRRSTEWNMLQWLPLFL
jgi:hypothetical protein